MFLTLIAEPSNISISSPQTIRFVANSKQNAQIFKEIGIQSSDVITVNFFEKSDFLERWAYILKRDFNNVSNGFGLLIIDSGSAYVEIWIGASEAQFSYLKDNFVGLASGNFALELRLVLASQEIVQNGDKVLPFGINPGISFIPSKDIK